MTSRHADKSVINLVYLSFH